MMVLTVLDISKVTTLEDFDGIAGFFETCLIEKGDGQ